MAALNPVARATDAVRGHVPGNANAGDTDAALIAAAAIWVLITIIPGGTRRRRPVTATV
jgi:ABC-2 type transport system permease protein